MLICNLNNQLLHTDRVLPQITRYRHPRLIFVAPSVLQYLFLPPSFHLRCYVVNKLCGWRHSMPPPLSSTVGTQRSSSFPRPKRSPLHLPHALRPRWVKRLGELDLKNGAESRVTWATSVSILVFLGLSVLDLGPMYATDRQTDVRQHHRFMPRLLGAGHNKQM